jgi:hypothetical protein
MRTAQAQMLDGKLKSLPAKDRQLVRLVRVPPLDASRTPVEWPARLAGYSIRIGLPRKSPDCGPS